jgi:hypothetical protein
MDHITQGTEQDYGKLENPTGIEEVLVQAEIIQDLMKSVMKPGVHYGNIPGFGNKPSLYKPGAEKILSAFSIVVQPDVVDLSTDEEVRYRVNAKGYASGQYVGGGVGECSSNEERLKWRKAVCDEEWNETPEEHRRMKWFKDRTRNWQIASFKQVRAESADHANTVLKIAKKRALIDLCLTATAASDLFAQDLEDLTPNSLDPAVAGNTENKVPTQSNTIPMPQRKTQPVNDSDGDTPIEDVIARVAAKELDNGGIKYGIETVGHGWFSSFKDEHGSIAQEAQQLGCAVKIDFVINGTFRNIKSIELKSA